MSLLRKAALVNSTAFVCLGLSIVQAAILARVLGPAKVGQYDLIRSVLVLAPQICCLGFPLSFLYNSQHDPENIKKYLMNTIWLMLLLGTGGGVVLACLVFFKTNYFGSVPWFALIGISLYVPILLGNVIARNVLLIQIEARRLSLMHVLSVVSGIVLIVAFYAAGILRVPQALLCFVFASFIGMIVGWIWARYYIDFSIKPSWNVSYKLGSMGIKLSWADMMVLINGQLSILIIKYLLDNFESVGYFSRGQRVSMLVVVAGQSVLPLLFSRWAAISQEKLATHVEKVLRFATTVGIVIVGGVLLTGKWIVLILYGRDFLPAVQPMMILVPGAALYLISRTLMQLLGSRGVPELSAATLLAGAATNVGLCWLLVPKMGISGAAYASVAGNIILLLLLTLIVRKKYDIKVMHCLYLNKSDIKSLWKSLLRKTTEQDGQARTM